MNKIKPITPKFWIAPFCKPRATPSILCCNSTTLPYVIGPAVTVQWLTTTSLPSPAFMHVHFCQKGIRWGRLIELMVSMEGAQVATLNRRFEQMIILYRVKPVKSFTPQLELFLLYHGWFSPAVIECLNVIRYTFPSYFLGIITPTHTLCLSVSARRCQGHRAAGEAAGVGWRPRSQAPVSEEGPSEWVLHCHQRGETLSEPGNADLGTAKWLIVSELTFDLTFEFLKSVTILDLQCSFLLIVNVVSALTLN